MSDSFRAPLSRRAKHLLRLIRLARYKDIQQALVRLLNQEIERTQQMHRRVMEAAKRAAAEKLRLQKKKQATAARRPSAKEPILQQQQQARQQQVPVQPVRKPTREAHHRNARLSPEQAMRITEPEPRPIRSAAARARQRLEGKRRAVTVPSAPPRKSAVIHVGGKPAPAPKKKPAPAVRPVKPARGSERRAAEWKLAIPPRTPAPARMPANGTRPSPPSQTQQNTPVQSRNTQPQNGRSGFENITMTGPWRTTPTRFDSAGRRISPQPSASPARPAPATKRPAATPQPAPRTTVPPRPARRPPSASATPARTPAPPARRTPVPLPSQTVARSAAARTAPRPARALRTGGKRIRLRRR